MRYILAAFVCAVIALPPSAGHAAGVCRVTGRVLCSEYGTRYKDPLVITFSGGGKAVSAEIDQDDGGFHAELEQGVSYDMRIGFAGNGFPVGRLETPADPDAGCSRYVEIYHSGSMLELVWEARAGDSKGGVDFKVRDPADR